MLLVDHALKAAEARGKPIRVAIVGVGLATKIATARLEKFAS